MLAVFWTTLNTELKAFPRLLHHPNMAYIPHPTEKLQVSSSHTMHAPLLKSSSNNTHPLLISTLEPRRKWTDHTSIWATQNLKWKPIYAHAEKKLSIHINRDGGKVRGICEGINTQLAQQHKNWSHCVRPLFSLSPPSFPSVKRTGNSSKLPSDEGCAYVIKVLFGPAQQ